MTKALRLNSLQEKIWLDDVLKFPTTEYNGPNYAFRVRGDLSIPTLREAYKNIMQEYLPFSSTIQVRDDMPFFIHESDTFEVPFRIIEEKEVGRYGTLDTLIDTLARQPFDLNREFPCRFYCIRCGADFYLFHLIHHVVLDANTAHQFFARLSEIYDQLVHDAYIFSSQTHDLEQYNSVLENNFKAGRQDNVTYWKQYLADVPAGIAIPQIIQKEASPSASFSFLFSIKPELESRLRELCGQYSTTLFRIYSSAWALTLSRMLNADEFLLLHSLSMSPRDKRIFGTYINNLPIKFNFGKHGTFSDLLRYANENRQHEKTHVYVHYSDFMPQSADGEKQKTLNVVINYPLSMNSTRLELVGCEVVLWKHVPTEIPADLMLRIESDGIISCEIRHNPRFETGFINSVAETFKYILAQVAEQPDIRLDDIRMVTSQRQTELLTIEHDFLHRADEPKTFLTSFRQRVAESPRQTAIAHDGKSITYTELDHMSDLVALALVSRDIRHNRVGLAMPKSIDAIAGILGILKSSNSYVPLDYTSPESRIRHIFEDCEMSLILVNQYTEKYFRGIASLNISDIDHAAATISDRLPDVTPQDEAYMIYTSGTTGVPKGIPISHRALAHTIANNISLQQLDADAHIMQYVNFVFDASVVEIFPALAIGAALFLPLEDERKDANLLHTFMRQNHITNATIPSVMVSNLPKAELPSLATIVMGGDTTTHEAMEFWSRNHKLINAYGPTENAVDATYNICTPNSQINDIGINMPGVTCYVLDRNQKLLPDYAVGELYIGGVKLARGYQNRPELNRQKFIPNPYASASDLASGINTILYKSGDLVMRRGDGHLIFLGRVDFQVKINGFRIELGEVESQIKNYGHDINDVVALAHDDQAAKTLVAYVLTTDAAAFDSGALIEYLRQHLPSYMIPAVIVPLHSFPYNTSGKVDRAQLPRPNMAKPLQDYKMPVTLTEKRLAKMWRILTKADFIGRDDNFISIGGDSISVIRLVFDINRVFSVTLRAADIYRHSTLSELAAYIDYNANTNPDTIGQQLLDAAGTILNVPTLTPESDLFEAGMTSSTLNEFVRHAASEYNLFFTTYDVIASRSIRTLVRTIDPNLYFWSEETYTDKPVIIFINGIVDYYPYNEPVVTALEKHFSVFCLESFCSNFIDKDKATLDELFKIYEDIVMVALKGKPIFAVAGYCVGAELSIAFAIYMQQRHRGLDLQVINMEGIYDRTLYCKIEQKTTQPPSFHKRRDIFDQLYETMPTLNYSGPIINIMVSQPMDFIPNDDETDEAAFRELVCQAWHDNIENWKRHYPNSPLYFVDCTHLAFREPDNLKKFDAIIERWKSDKEYRR